MAAEAAAAVTDMNSKTYFSMQWHITDRCDQRCKHCYIYAGKDKSINELGIKELLIILENFEESCKKINCLPRLSITGGDPLLHPDIWEFLEIIHNKKIPFGILGNPFHLNPSVIKKLEDLGCLTYQLSLDGTKDIHDEIRMKGSFDATMKALKLFENSKISANIMSTVSLTNIQSIPELVKLSAENKASAFGFARYCPNPDDTDKMISPGEYREFLEKMWTEFKKYKDCGTKFVLKDHLWKLFLYENNLFVPSVSEEFPDLIVDGCHCAISHITTLADATIYACRRCESPVGNALSDSFFDVFHGEKMNEYRKYDNFEHCSKCELKCFCRGCPAVAKCTSGNFYAKDPQCWHE